MSAPCKLSNALLAAKATSWKVNVGINRSKIYLYMLWTAEDKEKHQYFGALGQIPE